METNNKPNVTDGEYMAGRYVIIFYDGKQGYEGFADNISTLEYLFKNIPRKATDFEITDQLRRKRGYAKNRSDALKLIPKFEAIK